MKFPFSLRSLLIGTLVLLGIGLSASPIQAIAVTSNVSSAGIITSSNLNGSTKMMRALPDGSIYFLGTSAANFGVLSADKSSFSLISYDQALGTHSSSDFVVTGNTIYVSIGGVSTFKVYKYSIDGNVATYESEAVAQSGAQAIALGPDGRIYNSRSSTINIYESDLSSASPQATYKAFSVPSKMFISGTNLYYFAITGALRKITDYSTGSIGVNGSTDVSLTTGLSTPAALHVVGDTSYVATAGAVLKISSAGSILWRLPVSLLSMTVDTSGNISVVNSAGTVTTFAPIGPASSFTATSNVSAVTLNWTAGSSASGSDFVGSVIVRSTSGIPTSVSDGTVVTQNNRGSSYQDTGLEASTTYYYTIFNQTSDGFYSSGVTLSVTTAAGTPDAPVLSASLPAPNSGSVSLSWTAPALTATFLLQRSQDGAPATTISSNMDVSVTSYSDTGLNDGSYVYSLYAISASGVTSDAGVAATVNIDTTAPSAPTLEASKPIANGTTISLSWTVPSTTATFLLQRSMDGNSATLVSSNMASSVSSYTDTGLTDGDYVYSLYAIDEVGNTSNAGLSTTVTIDTIAPSAPSLEVSKPTPNGTTVSLAWSTPSGAAKFALFRSKDNADPVSVSSNISLSTTSYTDTDLTDGYYIYSIYAIDEVGNTSNAETSITMTIDTTAPDAPSTLYTQKNAPNGSSVEITWDVPTGTATFLLQRSKDGADPVSVSSNIASSVTSYTDTDLTDGYYIYSIYAIDEVGNTSNASVSATVNIDLTAPDAPSLEASKPTANGST
ncbi:MAG: hypothetical protein AB7F28_04050, partial [Candidatus Margulisiibacteriota bacterium]